MQKISQQRQSTPRQQQCQVSNPNNYLRSLFQTYKRKSFIPSYEIKYQIGSVIQKLAQQKQKIIHQLKQQELLTSTISEQQLSKYYFKKQQTKSNSFGIEIVKRIKQIFIFIKKEINSESNLLASMNGQQKQSKAKTNNQNDQFNKQLDAFTKLIKLIEDLDQFFVDNSSHFQIHQRNNSRQSHTSNTFVIKLYQHIFRSVCSRNLIQVTSKKVQQLCKKYNWPYKRSKNVKPKEKHQFQQQDLKYVRNILNRQACQYALSNFLSSLLNNDNLFKYNSGFFNAFYEKINNSIAYLFLEKHESHNFLEPEWMFEYIQESFNSNYQVLKDSILNTIGDQSKGNILIYVLQYSIQNLFYQNIKKRFETDLICSENQKQPLFYFKFVDSLHELEQMLTITFSQEICLLQNILIEFQIKRQNRILEKNFDYQHNLIENKIFKDFWQTINYSNVDLKNIQAYNIVTNFNVLFQKLYTKFAKIYDQRVVKKINQFYQGIVKNLAAHIKSSFQRIYNHSGLDKLGIILAFKRVDNQFKSGLNRFISKDLDFQKQIKKQYYQYILSIFNVYAIEQLNNSHKKLLKYTSQFQIYYTKQQVSQQEAMPIKQNSQKVFNQWHKKLDELNQVYNYKDSKVKNLFFTFLQSIDFTERGITLFLQSYEPFLKVYYSFEAYSILKMIIVMDKKQQLQYLKIHNNLLNFLFQSQINAIRKFKIN